jgi:hypothetical protein
MEERMPRFKIKDLTIDLPGAGGAAGGCGSVTNPCLLCTGSPTVVGGCGHITNPCFECTQNITIPVGCGIVTNPCLGCTHHVTYQGCLPCTFRATCGFVSCPALTCHACTATPTIPCGNCSHFVSIPCPGGTIAPCGATDFPGPVEDLGALKEQLQARLREVEALEKSQQGGGLPDSPEELEQLEQSLRQALDTVQAHRTQVGAAGQQTKKQ